MRAVFALLACCALLAPARSAAASQVTIYRCTDARGRLTLRDTPCAQGQQQETRSMIRPKDGTPAPQPVAPRPRNDGTIAPARIVVVRAPQPLYECVTPDDERYTSDTPEGHPRWVPLWTLGYPVYPDSGWRGSMSSSNINIADGGLRIHGSQRSGVPAPYPAAYNAGTWIRDTCHALPQQEVCARLVDRRNEIGRRFFNAMPSERDVLRVEERGIDARLDNDCGGH